MRESNFSFPSQNRASVCITSALYDRRALDCTAILPLINSLTHLTYLTSTSPRIREILTMDGGLERLVRILKTTKVNDKRSGWKWSMAFQCVANVGVRGSETIRTRVVDAGMVPVIITVLDNFLKALDHHPPLITTTTPPPPAIPLAAAFVGALENGNALNIIQMSEESEQLLTSYPHSPNSTTSIFPSSDYQNETSDISSNMHGITPSNTAAASTNRFLTNVTTPYDIRSSDDARSDVASWGSVADNEETTMPQLPQAITGTAGTNITPSLRPSQLPNNNPTNLASQSSTTLEIDVLYREEDILLSLQLLAYLSKYPHLRATFHTAYPPHNVFSLVEKFTHRLHPAEIQYWAGVIMRNACRKDEARGGIRQCAYMACGKWESYPREFAKCRRCRKAKYCSKACQSKAWSEGHRWWCMERLSHADADTSGNGHSTSSMERHRSADADTSGNGQSSSSMDTDPPANGQPTSIMERHRHADTNTSNSTSSTNSSGHRSRSSRSTNSTGNSRSTTNREATTVTTGTTSHGRDSGSVLVS
ncbi:384_t:CDS:2 [Funneliformis caledonium]|uniref:384_t:CDS:1 n=2 Tax=Funneliformis TaxID=1117308 RepID=A0A9N9A8P5_9GLOM|nr:384_t:CDS:2 [Funneliformis caledonium]CAG8568240.1 797_t:CDS:2 [Funneliformis mosseae]